MDTLIQSFTFLALGVVSNQPREVLEKLPDGFVAERVPDMITDRLRLLIVDGECTCITAKPEPFTYVYATLPNGQKVRMIYGLWIERRASYHGKKLKLARVMVDANEPVSEDFNVNP